MKHKNNVAILFNDMKMSLKCEKIARYLLPVFRSLVAKRLIEDHGFTQVEAAERLGTTQAAISQYMTSKRGSGNIKDFNISVTRVQKLADKTAEEIAKKKKTNDGALSNFCEICISLRRTN